MAHSSTMYKGDHRTFELSVIDEDEVAVDITGSTILYTVKVNPLDATPSIQKSSDNPGEIDLTDPSNGIAEINLLPADTQELTAQVYQFDVQITTASGKVHTLVRGTLLLEQDVTN